MNSKYHISMAHISRIITYTWSIALLITTLACNSDDNDDEPQGIIGEWLLIEMLADPGDGSGEYIPVDSSKRIILMEDGTYSSNGDICAFSSELTNPTSGSYESTDNGYVIDCESPFPTPLRLSLDNGYLIVAFSCIEPCLQKFERQD